MSTWPLRELHFCTFDLTMNGTSKGPFDTSACSHLTPCTPPPPFLPSPWSREPAPLRPPASLARPHPLSGCSLTQIPARFNLRPPACPLPSRVFVFCQRATLKFLAACTAGRRWPTRRAPPRSRCRWVLRFPACLVGLLLLCDFFGGEGGLGLQGFELLAWAVPG